VTDQSTASVRHPIQSSQTQTDTRIAGTVTFDQGTQTRSGSERVTDGTGTSAPPKRVATVPIPVRPVMIERTENKLLQLWEGRVSSVAHNEFTAVVTDKTDPKNPDEEVTISLDELGEEDVPLVRAGAVFYWSVRYEQDVGMPRQRVTRIRFRRLSGWNQTERERAEEFARQARALWAP
jgi:hypothetical protein